MTNKDQRELVERAVKKEKREQRYEEHQAYVSMGISAWLEDVGFEYPPMYWQAWIDTKSCPDSEFRLGGGCHGGQSSETPNECTTCGSKLIVIETEHRLYTSKPPYNKRPAYCLLHDICLRYAKYIFGDEFEATGEYDEDGEPIEIYAYQLHTAALLNMLRDEPKAQAERYIIIHSILRGADDPQAIIQKYLSPNQEKDGE